MAIVRVNSLLLFAFAGDCTLSLHLSWEMEVKAEYVANLPGRANALFAMLCFNQLVQHGVLRP